VAAPTAGGAVAARPTSVSGGESTKEETTLSARAHLCASSCAPSKHAWCPCCATGAAAGHRWRWWADGEAVGRLKGHPTRMAAKSTRRKAARAVACGNLSTFPRPSGATHAMHVENLRKGGAAAPPPQRAAARPPARAPELADRRASTGQQCATGSARPALPGARLRRGGPVTAAGAAAAKQHNARVRARPARTSTMRY
jgi:hypothetical protein